jgi:hypothetical protein
MPAAGCRCNGDNAINTIDVIAYSTLLPRSINRDRQRWKIQFTPASRSYTGNGTNWTAQNYDVVIPGDVAPPFAMPDAIWG